MLRWLWICKVRTTILLIIKWFFYFSSKNMAEIEASSKGDSSRKGKYLAFMLQSAVILCCNLPLLSVTICRNET